MQKSLTTPRRELRIILHLHDRFCHVCCVARTDFSSRNEESALKVTRGYETGRSTKMFGWGPSCCSRVHAYRSMCLSRPVFMLMCACVPAVNGPRPCIIKAYIVSRHTPERRCVHLFDRKDLVGPPCLPPSRLCLSFQAASFLPLVLHSSPFHQPFHDSRYFSLLPLPRLDRWSARKSWRIMPPIGLVPEIRSPQKQTRHVDTRPEGRAICRRGCVISMTRAWRIPGMKWGFALPRRSS